MNKLFSPVILFLFLFTLGCAGSKEMANIPESPNSDTTAITAETHSVSEATNDWHLRSPYSSAYYGTEVERAYRELLADKSPKEKIIVAIIDSGTDIEHEDLSEKIWVNEDEIPANGKDDDNNGYVDDIHGWNFIGGKDSTHVDKDTYEVTRLYAELSAQFEDVNPESIEDSLQDEYEYFLDIQEAYEDRVQQNQQQLVQIHQFMQTLDIAKQILNVNNIDSLEMSDLQVQQGDSSHHQQAKQFMAMLKSNGATQADLDEAEEYYDYLVGQQEYGLNPEFDPRHIVGDNYEDLSDRSYGNNDVTGPHNEHGTHVAGIVGAIRDNSLGIKGIADNISLMILRTVPDGDERDKDVGNAIRYAAENGARVVNMSFGKAFSPEKYYVDAAVRLADSLGVLLVSGSGNDGVNVDSTESFPNKYYLDGGSATNYLTVGASSWESDSTLAAIFSNYGKNNVDLFAPGVEVYSTTPDHTYEMQSGTSMASPVVAGIAALIMSYYPDLSTSKVKEILLSTVTPVDKMVYKPGSEEKIHFSELSSSGGIVNAYEALKLADELSKE